MLWRKESNRPDALYADIIYRLPFPLLNRIPPADNSSILLKRNAISNRKRKEGNYLFIDRKWAAAMEMYNDCLRFAENGSENIGFAYGNRSACFFEMKLYNECLVDIELAKEAGYPGHLMVKLDRRETKCLKHIEEATESDEFVQKLSFPPDANIPCMADVLKIERNGGGKLCVVAKEDIDVGQTIVLGKAFVALSDRNGWKCNICLKDHTNLVACKRCNVAMFCSDECQGHFLHDIECGLKFSDDPNNSNVLDEVRGILLAINLFANADELMDFVEGAIKSNSNEIPTTLTSDQSKYRAFLKMPISAEFAESIEFSFGFSSIYKFLLNIPKVKGMFKTLKHQRFLLHLVSHHTQITNFNSYHTDFHHQVGLMTRFFNHSCAPNVSMGERDGNSIYVTVRPVKKGEELLISSFKFLLAGKEVRQQILRREKHLICKCSRCNGVSASIAQRQQVAGDPEFDWILSNAPKLNRYDSEKIREMLNKCVAFLKKYGTIEWCDEIGKIVTAYINILHLQIARPVSNE